MTARLTLLYIHGIGNKPPAAILKGAWDRALGVDPSRSRMVYWVDRDTWPTPCGAEQADELGRGALLALRLLRRAHRTWGDAAAESAARAVRLGWLTRRICRRWLPDVARLLEDRQFARMRVVDAVAMAVGYDPAVVVVGHSLGCAVALDTLEGSDGTVPLRVRVPLLVTLGSPLGMGLFAHGLFRPLRKPACVGRWLNVADRLDPVALDCDLGDDVPGVEDHHGVGINRRSPAHPHSAEGYLEIEAVRAAVKEAMR